MQSQAQEWHDEFYDEIERLEKRFQHYLRGFAEKIEPTKQDFAFFDHYIDNPEVSMAVTNTHASIGDTFLRYNIIPNPYLDLNNPVTQRTIDDGIKHRLIPPIAQKNIVKYVATHEFGHVLTYTNFRLPNQNIYDITCNIVDISIYFLREQFQIEEFDDTFVTFLQQKLSQYSATSPVEMLAEAFATSELDPLSSNYFAHSFHDLILDSNELRHRWIPTIVKPRELIDLLRDIESRY